jgi:MFS family permease
VSHTFYVLVVTQTLSMIGSQMTGIAVGIRVFGQTGNTAPLLLMAFFNELPGMLGGSLVGVLVDRWDRRRVLIVADAGQALGSFLLMASFLTVAFQLWHLYAIVFMQGVFAVFQGPAKDASTTMLVPERQRDRANGILQMAFPLAGVIAPALTGALYGLIHIEGIILVDLLTFGVAVIAVYLVHIPRPPISEEGRTVQGNLWQEMAGGLRYLRARRGLLILALYFTWMAFLLNGPLGLGIPYLMTITGSEALTGLLMGASSFGALVGSLILAIWGGRRSRVHTFMPAFLLTGVMFLVYGTSREPLILGVALILLFLPLSLGWGLFSALIQAKTPPDMQGRLFAINTQLGFLASTTSFFLTGPLVDNVLEPAASEPGAGMGALLVANGVVILVSTLAVYALREVRAVESKLPNYVAVSE